MKQFVESSKFYFIFNKKIYKILISFSFFYFLFAFVFFYTNHTLPFDIVLAFSYATISVFVIGVITMNKFMSSGADRYVSKKVDVLITLLYPFISTFMIYMMYLLFRLSGSFSGFLVLDNLIVILAFSLFGFISYLAIFYIILAFKDRVWSMKQFIWKFFVLFAYLIIFLKFPDLFDIDAGYIFTFTTVVLLIASIHLTTEITLIYSKVY